MGDLYRHYLSRHAECWPTHGTPLDGCAMVVVIPVHNEPDLPLTLHSLARCASPTCQWTALLVINDCISDNSEVRQQNQRSYTQLQTSLPCPIAVIDATGLAAGKGGVGVARKIGMDTAIAAFAHNNRDGILVSLDADCTVNPDYLIAVEHYFIAQPQSPACVTRYCHPLDNAASPTERQAMIQYELHLRYYQLGLQQATVPYAFTTIGSCFACRASDYARQGGMNRRQAGEDFYFLHKIARRGSIGLCRDAVVSPSARITSRTPFGTGEAMATWLASGASEWTSYHPNAFIDLAAMAHQIDSMATTDYTTAMLPSTMQDFFEQQQGSKHLAEIRRNTATHDAFCKRFWHWFNGFLAMKFIRFACNTHHGWMPVKQAITTLLPYETNQDAATLLDLLRQHEREG